MMTNVLAVSTRLVSNTAFLSAVHLVHWCRQLCFARLPVAHLVNARRQQFYDGEVLAGPLHRLPRRPVVERPLHLHVTSPVGPCTRGTTQYPYLYLTVAECGSLSTRLRSRSAHAQFAPSQQDLVQKGAGLVKVGRRECSHI